MKYKNALQQTFASYVPSRRQRKGRQFIILISSVAIDEESISLNNIQGGKDQENKDAVCTS
jgi:hypothetical protein